MQSDPRRPLAGSRPAPPLTALLAAVLAAAPPAAAAGNPFDARITLTNRTGADKTDWPVFLSVRAIFGGNLPLARLDGKRLRVTDAEGNEVPRMLRSLPPACSVGNDEIVFLVPRLADGASASYRVRLAPRPAAVADIDLAGNANNLLPGWAAEGGAPPGWVVKAEKGADVAFVADPRRPARRTLALTLPVGSAASVRSARPVRFRKDGRYVFALWARTQNVAYNGWGFWGAGVTVRFKPRALRGRDVLTLRGTRPWHCYRFDPGGRDEDGVPLTAARAQTETVRKGRRRVGAALWAAGGDAHLIVAARQDDQPFLAGDRTGRAWLGEPLLFAQPEVAVDRGAPLRAAARDGAVVFARPINMPRMAAFAHEAVDRLATFALRGQRVRLRFGVHATADLPALHIRVGPLTGPGGALPKAAVELEALGAYVEPYTDRRLPAGQAAEYLLGIDVPPDAAPGRYAGAVSIATAPAAAPRKLPLALEVLPSDVPDMAGIWVGGIYNVGMGLARDDAFYRCYGKTRFNYLMLFDYLAASMKGGELDFAAADAQVARIVGLARVTGGIGLYREPNMSEDQPRKFYQIAAGKPDWKGKYALGTQERFKAAYQRLCRRLDAHAREENWPPLLYMVSDEPSDRRDVHPSMGWLNEALPGAVTLADAQFKDLLRTWQWYNLPVLDDPADWTGPLVYDFVKARKGRFGFCGTGWSLPAARYQPGLMLAGTGACYWHFWHTKGPFRPAGGEVLRSHAVAAMGAGFNDLRYYVALRRRIAAARGGPRAAVAAEAVKYLAETLALAPGDHDRHLIPHNGFPADWGDDRFYDRWRARMKDYLLRLRP